MRRISNLLAMLLAAAAFGQSPPTVEAVFIASTNAAFSNSWTFRIPLSVTNSTAFTNFPLEGIQYLKIRSVNPPAALSQTPTPPTPTIDTNLVQVGSVNLAWNAVSLAWHGAYEPMAYGVYWGTNRNQLASSVIVSVDETNTAAPLFAYGTNWLAVTSIDPLFQESALSPAISLTIRAQPITNVVSVTLLGSSNALDFYFVQTLLTLTNPPNTFYKLAITNQTQ